MVLSSFNLSSQDPSEGEIKLILAEEMSNEVNLSTTSTNLKDQLESFDLDSHFFRINYEQDLDKELKVGLSEVYYIGRYEEKLSGQDYRLDFDQLITSLNLEQVFQDYVALKFRLNYFIRQFRSIFAEDTTKSSDNKLSFNVDIEFFL